MSDALQASGVYWLAGLLGLLVLGQRLLKILRCAWRWDENLAAPARDGALLRAD